jgi:hypothetical protein
MTELGRVAYSFVVDADPLFAYEGWHLTHSLIEHSEADPRDIYVQFTPEVGAQTLQLFAKLGCNVSRLERFGDGRFCNKIAQWKNVSSSKAEHFVFLDTDVILTGDCREHLVSKSISAKIVDLANPPIETLDQIMSSARLGGRPSVCKVDASPEKTYVGNCNGGMYSVPREHADLLFTEWRQWSLWLLDNMEPLRQTGKVSHVDQVSFCLAIHHSGLPFALAPSNVNYYVHFPGAHNYFDDSQPISLLHYHNSSINVVGALEPGGAVTPQENAAVACANRQIARHFNNKMFWDTRYAHFIERGSGVGSRGKNLEYKRQLLRDQGAEQALSVLDVGCGDLEVVKTLALHSYVGVDQSRTALEIAKSARPDWTFFTTPAVNAPTAELVLCFEVLIHQETLGQYLDLIKFLAERTDSTLLVSGYEEETDQIRENPMLFYYEPLSISLQRTRRFKSITVVGRHSDVVIFRCEARRPE